MIDIEWAELHDGVFLAGTNLGLKLDPEKRTGLVLEYNKEDKHLHVTYNNKTTWIPEPNIKNLTPRTEASKPTRKIVLPAPAQKIQAQIQTPMSHVHAGPGAGDTGVSKSKMKF